MNARQFKKNFSKIKFYEFYGLKDYEYIVAEIDNNTVRPHQARLVLKCISDIIKPNKLICTFKGIDLKSIDRKQLEFMREQIDKVLGE